MYVRGKHKSRHGRQDLVKKLASELKKPHKKKAAGVPIISEEEQRFTDRLHVYVVWNAWKAVPEEHRGEIIVDAYEKAWGQEKAAKLSLAMGLTSSEAKSLGITLDE